jgi:branched-chain amino acid transport system permease protein
MEESTVKVSRFNTGRLMRLAPYIVVLILLLVLPPVLPDFARSLLVKVLIYSIFAMSLDLILGYTGLPSMGHAAYFGTAGYITGILIINHGLDNFWFVLVASVLGAGAVAAIFGLLALRVKQLYFLLVTMALGQLLFYVAWYWRPMTGGDDGLVGSFSPNIGIPGINWNPVTFYYFVLIFFVVCFLIMRWIANRPFGLSLKGVGQNELRMQCLGYNSWRIKYFVFIIGALFAGVGGVLLVYFNQFVVPANLGIDNSGLGMFIVILGGMSTLWGAFIGTAIILYIQYISSLFFPDRWPLLLGAAFILTAMLMRAGLAPILTKYWNKVVNRWIS